MRIDESRDITRYIINLLIFLGLLGTFWGLSLTVPAVVDTIRSLAPQDGDTSDVSVFDNLMTGLESQLGGMGTAFASSLVGLAGSLVVGLLELFAGHGQNRFYRELEEWLSSITKIGLSGMDAEEGLTAANVGVVLQHRDVVAIGQPAQRIVGILGHGKAMLFYRRRAHQHQQNNRTLKVPPSKASHLCLIRRLWCYVGFGQDSDRRELRTVE